MSTTNRDARAIWQDQPVTAIRLTPEQLRVRARQFQSRIRWRNASEYAASTVVVIWLGVSLPYWHNLLSRLGFVMVMLWAVYSAYCIYRFGSSAALPATEIDRSNAIHFHRYQLQRQRDLARAWSWILLPSIPGLVLALIGMHIEKHPGEDWQMPIAMAGVYAFIVIAVAIQKKWTADRLQREIDSLDSLDQAR